MRAVTWQRVSGPAEEPLTTADLKAHLRVSVSDEDDLLGEYARAAREWCEEYTGRALMTQTWDAYFAEWPRDGCFDLPKPPLQSVTSVKYTPKGAAQATLSAGVYQVVSVDEPGRIVLRPDQMWPSDELDVGLPIVVRLVCGYAEEDEVPAGVRQAMRWLVGHMNENREAVSMLNVPPVVMPLGARWALDPHRFRYVW